MKWVLASASPRRADILGALGIHAAVHPSRVAEGVLSGESAEAHAARLSAAKAADVAGRFPGSWVLGGDTVVAVDTEILGKPGGTREAVEMLLRLQGRAHRVVSALTLVTPQPDPEGSEGSRDRYSGTEVTEVTIRPFGRDVAEAYARTGEPMDKAGAYAIQGMGAALVERIHGDYTGVVGLPVPLLVRLLEKAGSPYRFPDRSSPLAASPP